MDTAGSKRVVLRALHASTLCLAMALCCDAAEGLYRIRSDNGKVGFIDATGKVCIQPQYRWADSFEEGVALVTLDGKWGAIDTTGRAVVPCRYQGAWYASEGTMAVKSEDRWGYVDLCGQEVVKCAFFNARPFACGLAAVYDGKAWGYINYAGEWVIEPGFASAHSHREGVALVSYPGGGLGRKVVDTRGRCMFEVSGWDVAGMSEGLLGVAVQDPVTRKTFAHYYTPQGKEAFRVQAASVSEFSEGRAVLTTPGEAFVVDRFGTVLSKEPVAGISPFSEGLAVFWKDDSDEGRRYGFLTGDGLIAIPPVYDYACSFSEGLALVHEGARYGTNVFGETVVYGGRWKYIDRQCTPKWLSAEESGVDFDCRQDWFDRMWPGQGIPMKHLRALVQGNMIGPMADKFGVGAMAWITGVARARSVTDDREKMPLRTENSHQLPIAEP